MALMGIAATAIDQHSNPKSKILAPPSISAATPPMTCVTPYPHRNALCRTPTVVMFKFKSAAIASAARENIVRSADARSIANAHTNTTRWACGGGKPLVGLPVGVGAVTSVSEDLPGSSLSTDCSPPVFAFVTCLAVVREWMRPPDGAVRRAHEAGNRTRCRLYTFVPMRSEPKRALSRTRPPRKRAPRSPPTPGRQSNITVRDAAIASAIAALYVLTMLTKIWRRGFVIILLSKSFSRGGDVLLSYFNSWCASTSFACTQLYTHLARLT